jgi:hypothetical protein
MTPHNFSSVISGAIILGYLVIALFFVRFWRQTHVRLFVWFAIAFALLAVERVMLVAAPPVWMHQPQFYCTRLVAFLLIAWAILDENRQKH